MIPELKNIADAVTSDPGRTPTDVVEAFLPDPAVVFGKKLRPVSVGLWLCFEKIGHPFLTGSESVTLYDVASAFVLLTKPTREVYAAVEQGDFRDMVLQLADELPMAGFDEVLGVLKQHFDAGCRTVLPMRSPYDSGQKKTAGSAGC